MNPTKTRIGFILIAGLAFTALTPLAARADDTVQIPANDESKGVVLPGGEGMPPASDAGNAPGHPIEAPDPPNKDPIAPVEPPPPSQ